LHGWWSPAKDYVILVAAKPFNLQIEPVLG
jgi:hypothetical protein